jgi:hypothetical protein
MHATASVLEHFVFTSCSWRRRELGRARAFREAVAIMSQSEAADVDHGADSDSVRYVPDSLAGDTTHPRTPTKKLGLLRYSC